MNESAIEYDVVIIGAGIVGLTLANALVNTDFSVAIVERNALPLIDDAVDCRVSAINRFALQHYSQSGVLDSSLIERACPFEKMFVWDQTGAGQIQFDSAELGMTELGVIVENRVLQHMLLERIEQAENIELLCPQEINKFDYPQQHSTDTKSRLHLASGQIITASLLVGADGVNSMVRAAASIERHNKAYQQQALVCNVSTSEAHQNTAWQCFMPSGPLAFLPMYTGQSSIVWSLDDSLAQHYFTMDEQTFKQELAQAAEFRLGEIEAIGQRYLFPLTHGHVDDYVKPGLALIGDAAHNIHPLAGQGANLGIADAFVLADILIAARQAGRHWAAQHNLMRYQRQRKGANRLMDVSMTGFKELFGKDNHLLSEIRNAGLSLVDNIPAIKYRIIRQALGVDSPL